MKSPREIALLWFGEVWNERNVALITELMAPDAVGHVEGPVPTVVGSDQFKAFQNRILTDMPDLKVTVLNVLADDTHASVLWQGEAHGGAVTFRGTTWFRVVDGLIVEGWDCWDFGGLSMRLAALPTC